MIPEAAVEAAAIGIASANLTSRTWGDLSEGVRGTFRDDARAALEAAAPHMLRGAWLEGRNAPPDKFAVCPYPLGKIEDKR